MSLVIRAKNDAQTVLAAGDENQDEVIVLEENWYFAPDAVNQEHLTKTERTYLCPYKGTAYWYDLDAPGIKARNVAWVYENAAPDYDHINGYIAFYPRETSGTVAINEADTSSV
jgi:uncharacterized protein (DUF427 family)